MESDRQVSLLIEAAINNALQAYTFQPNDENTWTTVKNAIVQYLLILWGGGTLVGDTPKQAFSVSIGLNQTMTAQDVAKGLMIITVGIATTTPGQFTFLTFNKQVQSPSS